jgi:TRAP-type C4-dicarboxylate transport system permease large subunit
VKSVVADVSVMDIFKGTLPFLFVDILNVILLVSIPAIALILPNTMR